MKTAMADEKVFVVRTADRRFVGIDTVSGYTYSTDEIRKAEFFDINEVAEFILKESKSSWLAHPLSIDQVLFRSDILKLIKDVP